MGRARRPRHRRRASAMCALSAGNPFSAAQFPGLAPEVGDPWGRPTNLGITRVQAGPGRPASAGRAPVGGV